MSVHVKKAEPGGDEGRPQKSPHTPWLDERVPPGARNGEIAAELASRLHTWAKQGQHGRVGLGSGFVLRRDPDRVRGPDIWFVQRERVPKEGVPQGFWETAPDLAVEVVAPSATVEEVKERLEDYFAAGTRLVWLIYPRFHQVEAHMPDGLMKTYRNGDTLEAPQVLHGFNCKVAELFSG